MNNPNNSPTFKYDIYPQQHIFSRVIRTEEIDTGKMKATFELIFLFGITFDESPVILIWEIDGDLMDNVIVYTKKFRLSVDSLLSEKTTYFDAQIGRIILPALSGNTISSTMVTENFGHSFLASDYYESDYSTAFLLYRFADFYSF